MARLQILELPEGSGDDRPPFVLVVDETAPQRIVLGGDTPWRDYWQDIADKIGARGVIVTPETVDIPANDVPVDENGHPLFLKVHVEGEFEKFRQQVEVEILAAQAKITRAVQRVSRLATEHSTGRPTHPDGTPYNYSEIVAGGWGHCDGCRTWGQWTPGEPHECAYVKGPAATESSPKE